MALFSHLKTRRYKLTLDFFWTGNSIVRRSLKLCCDLHTTCSLLWQLLALETSIPEATLKESGSPLQSSLVSWSLLLLWAIWLVSSTASSTIFRNLKTTNNLLDSSEPSKQRTTTLISITRSESRLGATLNSGGKTTRMLLYWETKTNSYLKRCRLKWNKESSCICMSTSCTRIGTTFA